MKKVALLCTLTLAAALYASDSRGADIDRLQTSATVLSQIMSAPDSAIPDKIMEGAKCIAIVPSMLKGGFIIGANYGKGVATCRTGKGWSAPVFFNVEGGSFGFQAGGQASDLVLVIRTDDGMQHLLQSKFKLGGDASAAAGPVGRDAQAMTDLTMRAQVLTYSRARGLFLGVSLSGGVIHQNGGDTAAFYQKDIPFRTVLSGEMPVPKEAEVFVNAVEKYAPTPRVFPTNAQTATPASTTTAVSSPTASDPAAAAKTSSSSTPATDTTASAATASPVAETTGDGSAVTATTDSAAATAEPAGTPKTSTASADPTAAQPDSATSPAPAQTPAPTATSPSTATQTGSASSSRGLH
jgi:lipid-binding SYLF domain-containing protein